MDSPLPVQKRIKMTELWAFLHVLMHALPPVNYITDHLAIVKGLEMAVVGAVPQEGRMRTYGVQYCGISMSWGESRVTL